MTIPPNVLAITGHQDLPERHLDSIRSSISTVLRAEDCAIGFSSLAAGADQLFAEVLLAQGGSLVFVRPSEDYEKSFVDDKALTKFIKLSKLASRTIALPFEAASEEAYWAAGKTIVENCSMLVAVWDGRPAKGLGGTADVVNYGYQLGRRVTVIWPDGAQR